MRCGEESETHWFLGFEIKLRSFETGQPSKQIHQFSLFHVFRKTCYEDRANLNIHKSDTISIMIWITVRSEKSDYLVGGVRRWLSRRRSGGSWWRRRSGGCGGPLLVVGVDAGASHLYSQFDETLTLTPQLNSVCSNYLQYATTLLTSLLLLQNVGNKYKYR